MKLIAIGAVLMIATAGPLTSPLSAELDIKGNYRGAGRDGVQLAATIKRFQGEQPARNEHRRFVVDISATGPEALSGFRCGGGARAVGVFRAETRRLIAIAVDEAPKPRKPSETCALVLDFRGGVLRVEESDGCAAYRGSNCHSHGILSRK